ncbi:MAG: hypothetical protein CM15mP95_3090 [Alphaproteobacteria bacterium]|nr:MAG: hypothetical protein CM15mP95_3090 [Alphaproteobacteria bacterium]
MFALRSDQRNGWFFHSGRNAEPNSNGAIYKGQRCHHGGQPMTMFKYASRRRLISKIKIIDAGNGSEMDPFRGSRKNIFTTGSSAQQLAAEGWPCRGRAWAYNRFLRVLKSRRHLLGLLQIPPKGVYPSLHQNPKLHE